MAALRGLIAAGLVSTLACVAAHGASGALAGPDASGASKASARAPSDPIDDAVRRGGFGSDGFELGLEVVVEGEGVIAGRLAETPRPAASAIKTAIAVVLLADRGDVLDEVPAGVDALLQPGGHPAFRGFAPEELYRAYSQLSGATYMELARVMMGRTAAMNDVYNAACNVLMIKLGGPAAIEARLHGLDPAFAGLRIDHYMLTWNGDGDNRATPRALVALYRAIARGDVPGLDDERVRTLRELVRESGDGGEGSVYDKGGTLYPLPMARVHAGFIERGTHDLVYAVMGEYVGLSMADSPETFVRLMAAVDSVAAACRRIAASE